jgi:hypothetical protein
LPEYARSTFGLPPAADGVDRPRPAGHPGRW